MSFFSLKHPLTIASYLMVGSALPLSIALISQYMFGLFPCDLCLMQRWPYAIIVVCAGLAVLLRHSYTSIILVLIVAIALWLTGAGIAVFHSGVEQGWWESTGGCTATAPKDTSLEALRAAILAAPLVSCKEASGKIIGLSMANWNILASLAFAAGGAYLFQQRRIYERPTKR